ncbi:hypothetical protein LCR01_14650 [Companilactobacillus crustorum]|uniref:Uncharacterized protein n=3 Tax=Companilactobacillus TaxID=2767879 RepID=A0A837RHV3_9LACO|nr:hypothetical protein [Companilactobacillus crustorum]KRK41955.1 hypothetical protein FD26_GL000978 [Companilactobacillus crustorum JCM 15951]KRO19916.1 hypothetical protein IV63_GL001085 [Companilactobacillus crustorum]GEO77022.1 hypothetical protein LCR01_14650 [Companilactobacillus crustorum]
MNKRGLIVIALGLLLLGTGCNKVTRNRTTGADVTRAKKITNYVDLSHSEKNEMTFEFTKSSSDAALVSVSLKVVNRTSKNIEFDGDSFILAHRNASDVMSTRDNKIVIKSNSTKNIKNLFEDVDATDFQKVGLYCYKNHNNKLAYSEMNVNVSRSSNLKNDDLQKSYLTTNKKKTKPVQKKNINKENDNQQAAQRRPAPVGPINTGQQAIALIESQNVLAPKGTDYCTMGSGTANGPFETSNGQSVYWVRLYHNTGSAVVYLDDWVVYQDRTVLHQAPGDMSSDSSNSEGNNDDNGAFGSNDESDENNDGDVDVNQGHDADVNSIQGAE